MPEAPINPPTRKPVSEFRTPSPAVVFYTEMVNRTDPAYVKNAPVKRGTLYSSIIGANQDVIATYPNLYFLQERKVDQRFGQNDQLVFWDWATVPDAEDTYNAEINYVANAVAYPAFTRVYNVRRDEYEQNPTLAIGSTLTALLGVEITNGGAGYTYATGTIDGTDVEIEFVISGGELISGVVVNEGTGVTSLSIITIDGDGLGALASPIIQPTSCVLTSQKKQELPDGDALRNEFVRVLRTYETLPGPFIASTRIDSDGIVVTINTRRNIAANITSQESLGGGTWTKTTKKGDDNFVGEEGVETRAIPGNAILETQIDKNGDITSITRTLVQASTIATTNVILAGVWTRTFEVPLDGSKLVATKTVEVRNTQNELDSFSVEIPDLIPVEFRPQVPIIELEGTFIGDAALPTLVAGELFSRQTQLDAYTYRSIRRGRIGIELPKVLTNQELTEAYGGGTLFDVIVLELNGANTIDEGLTVVSSKITVLDDLGVGVGLQIRESRGLHPSVPAWPILYGTHVDERHNITVNIQRQTVAAGTTGGVLGDGTIVEVQPHDKWRSIQISSKLDVDTLPEDTQWFGSMQYSFPPELIFNLPTDPVIDWAFAECGCSFSFSAVLVANMNQYHGIVKTRVTEQFYDGPPPDDVTITQFFPQAHNFGFAWASACGDADGNCRTKSGALKFFVPLCLHDDLSLSIGANIWTFAATSPAVLPHGNYIMLAPHVERWRFGAYRRVLTEVLVP